MIEEVPNELFIPGSNHKIVHDDEAVCVNLYPVRDGRLKSIGYKSIDGLVQAIRMADKNCKKYGFKMKLEITLPVEKNESREYRYVSKKITL